MTESEAIDVTEKRICLVTSTFPRWLGDSVPHFVLELATDLSALGWQVDVLAPHCAGAASYEEMDGIRVTRFRYLWPATIQTMAYGDGGAVLALRRKPWNALKLPFFLLAQIISLYRLVKRRNIDVINSHWVLPQGFSAAIVAGMTGVSHVITAHGGDVLGLKSAVFEIPKRFALKRSAAVTANSSVTEAAVCALAPRGHRIERIPLGASEMPMPPPAVVRTFRSRFAANNESLLLFVGRLIAQKGCVDILDAMTTITKSKPDVRLIIAGDGPDRQALETTSGDLGIGSQVEFVGWATRDELLQLYHAADIFVAAPTKGPGGEVEAFGLVFAEAALAGLPAVATRSGGIVDIVIDGETGLLTNEHDPDQFAQAVLKLLEHPAQAQQMGAAARERAEILFTREVAAATFSQLFRETIG